VSNCSQGVRASVGPSVCADAAAGFKEGFQARGRGFKILPDGERLLGQRMLMHVLD
jgi:hypothetical protein